MEFSKPYRFKALCSLFGLVILVLSVDFTYSLDDLEAFESTNILNEDDIPIIEGFGETVTIPEEDDVIILTNQNFQHVIGTKSIILVEFYAPWCGHCKSLEPEYSAAAKVLKEDGIRIAKLDATVEDDLAKEFGVSGFPTIKLFKSGQFYEDYEESRTSIAIIEYMKRHADPNYMPPPTAVRVLTSLNFSSFVDSENLSLVEFYAPWCGHCKQLAPEYEGAAQDLKQDKILLAKVDATEEKDLAEKYGVTGYPRLLVFRHGQSFDFHGQRNRRSIVDYMREQAKPPSKLVSSVAEAKAKMTRTEPSIFAHFDGENNIFSEYILATNHLREDYIFLHTFDKLIAEKYGLKFNSLNIIFPEIFHSKYEKKIQHYDKESWTIDEVTNWLSSNSIPLVGQRLQSNMAKKYTYRPLVVIYYDVNFGHQYIKDTQFVRNKILPIANKHRDLVFAICNEEEFMDELKTLGLDDSGEDINVAIFGEKDLKYPMDPIEDFEAEIIEQFILKFKRGYLKPYLRSQPIPKRQDGPVRVVVAKSFDSEVLQNKKDILIEFYAPWCGHCKKLEPIYKKVAKYYMKGNSNLVVAKMDATANDVPPQFSIEGFPTIYLLKADSKDTPILFQRSERTFDGFKEFLDEHLSSLSKDEL